MKSYFFTLKQFARLVLGFRRGNTLERQTQFVRRQTEFVAPALVINPSFLRMQESRRQWIPAFAGMTVTES
jgi:hypothetical protein